ncbi:MAG: Holliday junction resolvase RuvX [Armatimonadetes bacterium]|nr:Holliday junction resolvase RuvX [Armatimonadota bacterium]
MRVVAVDWGTRRIGIAVGESDFGASSPRPHLSALGALAKDARQIVELARKEGADAVLVGIPINPHRGEPGTGQNAADDKMERLCRALAEQIEALGMLVLTADETMTSVRAEDALIQSGQKASLRDRRRDSAAAALLLEGYFAETQSGTHSQGDGGE